MDTVGSIIQTIAIVIFISATIYAAISDLRSFEIPNWVSGLIVLGFVMIILTAPDKWPDHLDNILTGLGVLFSGFVLFALRVLGAGDVKLLTAIALWMGWPHFLPYFFLVAFAGGLLSILLILFRRKPLSPRLTATGWIVRLHARPKDVPYAVAIALPALFFLPRTPLVAGLF